MFRAVPVALTVALLSAGHLGGANITVETTVDADAADADCSLREAIVAANDDAAYNGCAAGTGTSDRIVFDLTLPATITLASDLPEINESVAIVGPGMDQLTVDGADLYALPRFDNVTDPDPWLFVSGITLTNGLRTGAGGGALFVSGGRLVLRESELSSSTTDDIGGGLFVSGDASVERSRILENTASAPSGGGGIYVYFFGSLELVDSTVAGNSTTHESSGGGGVKAQALTSLVVRRSTISGNESGGVAGGIEALPGFMDATTRYVTIESSTITQNHCNVVSSANYQCGGGARFAEGTDSILDVTIANSVIAQNEDELGALFAHDLVMGSSAGLVFTSGGFNLIGDHTGSGAHFAAGLPNGNGDFVGTTASPLDPQLGVLAPNGGPTPTHLFDAVVPHPLIDQGACAGELADQRGHGNAGTGVRIVDVGPAANNPEGDGCDIGAVEAFGSALAPAALFADGFESARLLFWSGDAP